MSQMLERIQLLHETMKSLTLEAGVPESVYNKVLNFNKASDDILEDRIRFLENIMRGQYEEVRYIYALIPPETWTMYKLLGENNFEEQIQLRKAQRILKYIWVQKYGRTHKKSDSEASE